MLVVFGAQAYDFGSVQSIVAYSNRMPEFPQNDNDNPYKPSFVNFNQLHVVSYIDQLLYRLGFRSIVAIDDFITIMRQVIEQRELNGYFGNFVQKQYITSATRWFVCGSLYGALHAQVAILQHLKEQQIINDALELIQADTYLVFTDTICSYTPYGLESLWIVLKLMAANPEKVLVIKTTDWPSDTWTNSTLTDAFYHRFNRSPLLLKQLLDAFVNTLPDAVYLIGNDDHIVKITAGVQINEALWDTFFKEKVSGIFHGKYIPDSHASSHMRAMLDIHPDISPDMPRVPTLKHIHKTDIDIWSLISSPVEPLKTSAHIHHDAFVEIRTDKDFAYWKLFLWGQSIHDRIGFQLVRSYDLLSGALLYSSNIKEYIKVLEQQVSFAQQEVQQARNACNNGENHEK